MTAHKADLVHRQKSTRPQVVVKVTLVAGTGGIAGLLLLLFREHAPFSPQAGAFENALAVIVLVAAAMFVLTLVLDHMARSRLIHRAGRKMVDTAQTHDEARQAFHAVNQSTSGRLARWWLGFPAIPVILEENDEEDDNSGHKAD
jgi:hypothetical protein